jgi:hypothetical protein
MATVRALRNTRLNLPALQGIFISARRVVFFTRISEANAMKLSRRRLAQLAAAAAAVPVVSRIAVAQTYPARPLRWIVGFPPAGGADVVVRIVAPWLSGSRHFEPSLRL